jgi:hypothetical protein
MGSQKLLSGLAVGSIPIPMPIATKIRAIMNRIMKAIITAIMLMTSALSQPQSKKCFTNASQIISIPMYAIMTAIPDMIKSEMTQLKK